MKNLASEQSKTAAVAQLIDVRDERPYVWYDK